MTHRAYVAGPMRGYDKFNFPMFDRVSAWLTTLGYMVTNPAAMDRAVGFSGESTNLPEGFAKECVLRDVGAIANCDVIALLPGWHNSVGARSELAVARWLGLQVFLVSESSSHPGEMNLVAFDRE